MANFALTTPVAFIIFNRPEVTTRVFAEIARARPSRLLVIGDGPRADRAGEAERVKQARAIVQRVDWPCEVLKNFSEVNLGCRERVSSGIDWIFEQVEEAIILEDDCLPHASFFRYCQELLARYRDDQRIGLISGDNFQFGRRYSEDSYYFSKYVHIWGWATWRSRWQTSYDVTLRQWPRIRDQDLLVDLIRDEDEIDYWRDVFERVYQGQVGTWDYQWVFANWLSGRLAVLPAVNLISNIGFGANATHTVGGSRLAELTVEAMQFPLIHPVGMMRNSRADRFSDRNVVRPTLWRRAAYRLRGKFGQLAAWPATSRSI
jgi:hypothetical protein